MPERIPYDEFGLFHENAAEYGIPYDGPPDVERVDVEVEPGRSVSSLLWGARTGPPELVLVHGGAQNAHTWDTVALALGRPLLALDLPGHGHSDGGPDGSISPTSNGRDLAAVVAELAPSARGVVGMSLGGVSSLALAAEAPELVRALGVGRRHAGRQRREGGADHQLRQRPRQLRQLRRPVGAHDRAQPGPLRVLAAARHPAQCGPARGRQLGLALRPLPHRAIGCRTPNSATSGRPSPGSTVPLLLVRGLAWSVVDDDDVAELLRRQPTATVVGVEGAGHSVQGDRPLELAAIIDDFLFGGS